MEEEEVARKKVGGAGGGGGAEEDRKQTPKGGMVEQMWSGEVGGAEVVGLRRVGFLPVSLGPAGDCPCKG